MFDTLHVICAWHVGIVITAGSLYTARPTAYLYTTDLVALQACNSAQVPQLEFTKSAIRPPLLHDAWVAALSSHPDRNFVTYICTGLGDGFRIGFAHTAPLRSASANMFSAVQHPEIIDEYISKELRLGRILATSCHPAIHINRFGVIPKGHNSGKWRLITGLSYPPGNSVNDGIDPNLCSLQYTTVEDVAGAATKLGRGELMAKIDIEAAYRSSKPRTVSSWHPRILIAELIIWPMTYRVITYLPSCWRFREPAKSQFQYPPSSWKFYWTCQWTGHHQAGLSASGLFSQLPRPIDTSVIWLHAKAL